MDNWFLLDEKESISLENVGLITNFLGGIDEDWFVTVHVCIENAASDAVKAAETIAQCTGDSDENEMRNLLKRIEHSFKKVNKI
ncbi:uncharacterized protein METZ01_LOCUS354705, partial [marine metagenome]